MSSEPFVSVVTPVRNGGKFLAECIESILAQSYTNWDYTIVDNFSSDDSLAIARRYAAAEPRIRVVENPELIPMLENWNLAMRQISPDCKYVKVIHADDTLFPDCIARMVELAERRQNVGMVGSLRLAGDQVQPDPKTLRFTDDVLDGRSVCRDYLLGGPYIFGSPTSTLIRADLVRAKDPFYNEKNLHADSEICLEILAEHDFGYLQDVLTFTRKHPASVTSTIKSRVTTAIHQYHVLQEYGPRCLRREEGELLLRRGTRGYYLRLWKSVFLGGGWSAWRGHVEGLRKLGYSLEYGELLKALLYVFLPWEQIPSALRESAGPASAGQRS